MKTQIAMPTRTLAEVAAEIRRVWLNVHFGAKPYLDAMSSLNTVKDMYGEDTGLVIVSYFLSNARNWRGEDAKRIKAELNRLCKG